MAEKRKQERQALAKEREERKQRAMAEKNREKEIEEAKKEEEEQRIREEEEEAKRKNLLATAPVAEMTHLQHKIAQLEGFGTGEMLAPEIRLFLIRPGQKGKTIAVKRDSPNFSWLPFNDLVRETCAIEDKVDALRIYSAIGGRISSMDDLQGDDILFVTLQKERKDEAIKLEIRKLKEAKERAEIERKQREVEAREKAQLQMKRIMEQREAALKSISEEKRNQMLKLQEVKERRYECEICMDDVTMKDLFTVDHCYHRFCRDCMQGHIEAQIEVQAFVEKRGEIGVVCPGNGCDNVLGIHEVKSCVPSQVFERYDGLLRDSAVTKTSDMIWCATPDCGNALITVEENSPMVVCYACYSSWCTRCQVPWHGDMTCEEYRRYVLSKVTEVAEDLANNRWMSTMTKACPQCCVNIEKNEGCNHMTCSQCWYEFCWVCLKDWECSHYGCH